MQTSPGFSLIELVITIAILSVLTLGLVPLVKVAERRQREQRLREALREMRAAIDEFHRDAVGMQCVGMSGGVNNQLPGQSPDPRSRVIISDCTIFTVDNPEHYPPDLETLVNGVNVVPRLNLITPSLGSLQGNATDNNALSMKKKVYLRGIPIDPMTGRRDWVLRSCYDSPDSASWGGENIFDIKSKSEATALNGEKYRDW